MATLVPGAPCPAPTCLRDQRWRPRGSRCPRARCTDVRFLPPLTPPPVAALVVQSDLSAALRGAGRGLARVRRNRPHHSHPLPVAALVHQRVVSAALRGWEGSGWFRGSNGCGCRGRRAPPKDHQGFGTSGPPLSSTRPGFRGNQKGLTPKSTIQWLSAVTRLKTSGPP